MEIQRPSNDVLIIKDPQHKLWFARVPSLLFVCAGIFILIGILFGSRNISNVGMWLFSLILPILFIILGVMGVQSRSRTLVCFDKAAGKVIIIQRDKTTTYALNEVSKFSLVEFDDGETAPSYQPAMILTNLMQVALSSLHYDKEDLNDVMSELNAFLREYRRTTLGRFH